MLALQVSSVAVLVLQGNVLPGEQQKRGPCEGGHYIILYYLAAPDSTVTLLVLLRVVLRQVRGLQGSQ